MDDCRFHIRNSHTKWSSNILKILKEIIANLEFYTQKQKLKIKGKNSKYERLCHKQTHNAKKVRAFHGFPLFTPISTGRVNAAPYKCHLTFRNLYYPKQCDFDKTNSSIFGTEHRIQTIY